MSTTKVAVVTGSNKGIGYAIVKGLCEKFDGNVYLTARDENRGRTAVEKLKQLGFNPLFQQLNISDEKSIANFRDYIKKNEGGIDVLVNNAGIAYHFTSTVPFSIQAEDSVRTNYFDNLRICEMLFPLLRPNAQVVNISSSLGHLSRIPSLELRAKFSNPSLTIPELNALMQQFVEDVKNDKHIENGWGSVAYGLSKVGFSALSIIQQREFDKESRNISVNHVHPGYVATDMSNFNGALSIEQGARAPLFLALGGHNLKGQFVWLDCSVGDWYSSEPPKEVYQIGSKVLDINNR